MQYYADQVLCGPYVAHIMSVSIAETNKPRLRRGMSVPRLEKKILIRCRREKITDPEVEEGEQRRGRLSDPRPKGLEYIRRIRQLPLFHLTSAFAQISGAY